VVQLISLCQCCTRSEGIDQSWSSSNCYIFWVCLYCCLVIRHADRSVILSSVDCPALP